MRGKILVTVVALAFTACDDPDTADRRGYTKAPLEDPGLLVSSEPESPMPELGRPNKPRPSEPRAATGAADAEAEPQEVTLAQGVTQAQFDQGQQLFGQSGCGACHGPSAGGSQLAPSLTDAEWLNVSGANVEEIATIIRQGVPQPKAHPAPMPPMGGANLTPEQVQALAAYVASIGQG